MAAPTDVRVEAASLTSTILRWAYSGTSVISVWRSLTSGGTYTDVTATTGYVAAATLEFTDVGLSAGTKYFYKLSEDSGANFSSIVNVYTMSCGKAGSQSILQLPQATDEVDPEVFNELSSKVEAGLNVFKSESGQTCVACISDGALVIDCFDFENCPNIDIIVDQDVNSISLPNCDDKDKTLNFIVAPNATRKICGFPDGFNFGGDECFRAPIAGGSAGTTVSASSKASKPAQSRAGVKRSASSNGTGLGGGGGSSCTCRPSSFNRLTIKSCNADNSLACATTKSNRLIACGGRGPYTWSLTGSITVQVGENGTAGAAATGSQVIVKPAANAGSAVAGTAYQVCYWAEQRVPNCAAAPVGFNTGSIAYSCDDVAGACNTVPASCGASPALGTLKCILSLSGCDKPECAASECGSDRTKGPAIDLRTAPMIAANCAPCGIVATGATVTVTDANGTSASIVLRS
jgi:hypothetical protein